jgi:hypothetical protein
MILTVDMDVSKMAEITRESLIEELVKAIPPMHYLKEIEAIHPSPNGMCQSVYINVERLMDEDQYLLF